MGFGLDRRRRGEGEREGRLRRGLLLGCPIDSILPSPNLTHRPSHILPPLCPAQHTGRPLLCHSHPILSSIPAKGKVGSTFAYGPQI